MDHHGVHVPRGYELFTAVSAAARAAARGTAQRGAADLYDHRRLRDGLHLSRPQRPQPPQLLPDVHRLRLSGRHHHQHHRLCHEGLRPLAHNESGRADGADVHGCVRRVDLRRHQDLAHHAAGQEPAPRDEPPDPSEPHQRHQVGGPSVDERVISSASVFS